VLLKKARHPHEAPILTHVSGKNYVLGVELQPRVPIGSDICVYDLETDTWQDPVLRMSEINGKAIKGQEKAGQRERVVLTNQLSIRPV
jgi:hypothetical protein